MSLLRLALERGLLSGEQVAQVRDGAEPGETLDQALLRLGFLTGEQVERLRRGGESVQIDHATPEDSAAEIYQLAMDPEARLYGVSQDSGPESNTYWHQGKYRIERTLGEGLMGKVYLARETAGDRRVVLKLMKHLQQMQPRSHVNRFRREIHALRQLEHRGIARIIDHGVEQREHQSIPWFATEYRPGSQLRDWVAEQRMVPVGWALRCAVALGQAAGYAHRLGFVHRDIKPDNVIVEHNQQNLFLIDFGLVKVLFPDESFLESTAACLLGSWTFMSPEQATGGPIGPQADVYSLAGLLQWMLTGVPANHFKRGASLAETLQAVSSPPPSYSGWPHLDDALEAICHRALAQDPGQRHSDGAAFARDVSDYLETHDRGARHLLLFVESTGRRVEPIESAAAELEGIEWVQLIDGYAVRGTTQAGIEVNGRSGQEHRLQHGDRLQIGPTELVYRREA